MTTAVIKYINSRDKLYKSLMLTPKDFLDYLEVQRNFKTYKNIIRRSNMIAKRDYYNKLFNKHSTNLKTTWKAINDTLNRHKTKNKFPETFKLSNGQIISDTKEIATAFNDYYEILDTVTFVNGMLFKLLINVMITLFCIACINMNRTLNINITIK